MADDLIKLQFKYGNRIFDDIPAGFREFTRDLQRIWGEEFKNGKEALLDYLNHVARVLADKHGKSWPGGTTDNSLSMRTGRAVASIIESVKVAGTTWESLAGSIGGINYLAIHEYGGELRGEGKMLTIPLPAAMSGRGTSPPFARQWSNTFVARSKRGNLLIFQKRGNGIVPLYVLKPSVRIKPRLGMRKTLETEAPYFLAKAADLIVEDFHKQLG